LEENLKYGAGVRSKFRAVPKKLHDGKAPHQQAGNDRGMIMEEKPDLEPKPAILVVDDIASNADLLEAYLLAAGYLVQKAYDGEEALRKVEEKAPDLILLDIMMPKLDGYEVCRRLKADERTVFIPIVMITALKEQEDKIRGIEVGADDFLTKPFNKVELLIRVRSLLRIKKLHDRVEAANRLLEQRVAERTAKLEEALRELKQLDRLKNEFLSNISHELKTPLTPMKGYIRTILQEALGPLSPGQRRGLMIIQESVEQLQRLIDDLLAYIKMEGGKLRLDVQPVSLPELLRQISEGVLPVAKAKDQTLTLSAPDDLPRVLADPMGLKRALSHLLDNAIKFTPRGGTITMTARRAEELGPSPQPLVPHGDFDEISVTDTGIGIPSDQLGRIFDRFYQVDGSITREHGGIGIGLAIVQQIIEAHGSRVEVESRFGQGSTFRFLLPVA